MSAPSGPRATSSVGNSVPAEERYRDCTPDDVFVGPFQTARAPPAGSRGATAKSASAGYVESLIALPSVPSKSVRRARIRLVSVVVVPLPLRNQTTVPGAE